MSPILLELEGSTLGEKHKHYNQVVKIKTTDATFQLEELNCNDNDIDNLVKIDVACLRHDADYVLEVLRGGDALYVAHALKRSAWLLADDEYAHVINPHYLQRELFPKTTNAAKNKMLLAIRLNLKNEARVDEFYNFYKEDFKFAQKWLPHCSEPLVISVIENEATQINDNLMKRLCRKSFAILKACCEARPSPHWLKCGKIFLYTDTEQYLELINTMEHYYVPKFGKKATRFIMNKCPDRILDHFHKYCYKIDLCEFSKHFNTEAIRDFLSKQMLSDHYEVRAWCKHMHVKHLIRQIPEEERFQFVREMFLDKGKVNESNNAISEEYQETKTDFYSWYRYVPFETAFTEMKGLIFCSKCDQTESEFGLMELLNSAELTSKASVQVWALKILVRSTRGNLNHIQTLIRYYRDNHDIEPYDDPFSSILCKFTKTHRYDETTWDMLNDIFYSMGIYRNDRNIIVPYCIQAIVVYNILHDKSIPKVVEEKVKLSNFRNVSKKFDPNEKQKVFAYLINFASTELVNKKVEGETDFTTVLSMCGELVKFLEGWNRNVAENPLVVGKIRELIQMKNIYAGDTDSRSRVNKTFSRFFIEHKCLRIHLFEESLFYCLNDETCLNILKHDPELLLCQSWMEVFITGDTVSLRRTFFKLRIYWPNSIIEQWTNAFVDALDLQTVNKSCVEAIFILLPRKEALTLLNKYIPANIVKLKEEEYTKYFILIKDFVRSMRHLRPLVSIDTVLLYTERDYYRYVVPLLDFILVNISYLEASPYVKAFLNMSGALQKVGIRYMLRKMNTVECKKEVKDIWINTSSHSVKCGLLRNLYKHLIKGQEPHMVQCTWEVISELFDHLTPEFYDSVKIKFDNYSKVPKVVRLNFFLKSLIYLIAHPATKAKEINLSNSCFYLRYYVDQLEVILMSKLLLNAIDQYFKVNNSDNRYYHTDILRLFTAYLTTNDDIEVQQIKFVKNFLPLMEYLLTVWPNYSYLFRKFLESLSLNVSKRLTKQYTVPIILFRNIQININKALTLEKDYFIITFWNITVMFVELLEKFSKTDEFQDIIENTGTRNYYYKYQYENPIIVAIYSHIAPAFGYACLNYLKQDNIVTAYPSLYPIVSKALMNAFVSLSFPYSVMYKTLKHMLHDTSSAPYYTIVIGVIRFMYMNSGSGEYNFTTDEELKNIILSHPSKEVRAHYHNLKLYSHTYCEDENVNWRRAGFMYGTGRPNCSDVY